MLQEGRIGSALNYQESYRSLKKFKGNIYINQISVSYLIQYEQWMISRGRSKSTVGIRLRHLRAVFNEAIENRLIKREESYPFGRRKYQIPSSRNIKKALTSKDISDIYYYQSADSEEMRAKDYWLFCYLGNGINPRDVAFLKYKNINEEFIVLDRAKTDRTSRNNARPIIIYLSEEIKVIIKRLGNKDNSPANYIFPILDINQSPLEQYFAVKAFIKFVNDGMSKIRVNLGIEKKITTIVSRHSFSTQLKRSGASTEFIQEALGHTDKRTTESYLDSFENHLKKEFAKKLTDFKSNSEIMND